MSETVQKPRFEFKIQQQDLEQVAKVISTLVEDATFCIDVEGITFRGMDPSHVAMIDIALPNAMFEKYDVEGESKFAVRIEELTKLVKQFDKRSNIRITTNEDNELILSNREFTYKLRMIESSVADTPLPKIPYDARAELTNKVLSKYLQKIQVVSDYATFEMDEQNFVLSGKGDSGELKIHLERGHEDLMDLNVRQDSTTTYSLEYLIPHLKQFPPNTPQVVEYSSVKPIRIDSKISNIGRIHFYLAPRVES